MKDLNACRTCGAVRPTPASAAVCSDGFHKVAPTVITTTHLQRVHAVHEAAIAWRDAQCYGRCSDDHEADHDHDCPISKARSAFWFVVHRP